MTCHSTSPDVLVVHKEAGNYMECEMRERRPTSEPLTVDLATVEAVTIGSTAASLLSTEGVVGRVDGVFIRTVNVLTEEGELFTLARKDVPKSQITITLDIPLDIGMFTFDIKTGASVIKSGSFMRISQSAIHINLDNAVLWKAQRQIKVSLAINDIRKNCNIAKDISSKYGKQGGLSELVEHLDALLGREKTDIQELNLYSRMAFPHIATMAKAVSSRNLGNLGTSIKGLVGLGPGLTPSCDDMLMGFMSSLLLVTEALGENVYYAREVNQAIVSFGKGQTTRLSQKLMEHAAQGETSEVTHNVIKAIIAGTKEQVTKATFDLLSVGYYSGIDTLLGILMGFDVAMNMS